MQNFFIVYYVRAFQDQSNDLFLKYSVIDWIFHSSLIYGPKLCKQDGTMKTRLAANIDGYLLRRSFFLEQSHFDGSGPILSCRNDNEQFGPG